MLVRKKWLLISAIYFFLFYSLQAQNLPYHKYQIGIEGGIGDNSAPETGFPFGSSIGGFFRFENHTIGVRRDYYSILEIFQTANYYQFINLYYGFTYEKKNVSVSPQLGIGNFETNYFFPAYYYHGASVEISLDLTTHIRGNGIGVRPFFNYNNKVNYFGAIIHLTLGWAWK